MSRVASSTRAMMIHSSVNFRPSHNDERYVSRFERIVSYLGDSLRVRPLSSYRENYESLGRISDRSIFSSTVNRGPYIFLVKSQVAFLEVRNVEIYNRGLAELMFTRRCIRITRSFPLETLCRELNPNFDRIQYYAILSRNVLLLTDAFATAQI